MQKNIAGIGDGIINQQRKPAVVIVRINLDIQVTAAHGKRTEDGVAYGCDCQTIPIAGQVSE